MLSLHPVTFTPTLALSLHPVTFTPTLALERSVPAGQCALPYHTGGMDAHDITLRGSGWILLALPHTCHHMFPKSALVLCCCHKSGHRASAQYLSRFACRCNAMCAMHVFNAGPSIQWGAVCGWAVAHPLSTKMWLTTSLSSPPQWYVHAGPCWPMLAHADPAVVGARPGGELLHRFTVHTPFYHCMTLLHGTMG